MASFRSNPHTNLPTCFSTVRMLLISVHRSSNIFHFPPTQTSHPSQPANCFNSSLDIFMTAFCSLSQCIMGCCVLRLCRLHKQSFISMPCMNHKSYSQTHTHTLWLCAEFYHFSVTCSLKGAGACYNKQPMPAVAK